MIYLIIKIADFEFTEVWDGILYKKLSNYPNVTDWEIRNIIEFIEYEKKYNRECELESDNKALLNEIIGKVADREKYINALCPKLITECTACTKRGGCVTEFVCHTTSIENAKKIFESGKLLSALNARKVPVELLMNEKRNAANDPADYFEYIMLSWGNCQAGDRLVMERKLGRFPNEDDLSVNFTPGIRFYFKYNELVKHPNRIFDGVLPMKIKDEIKLSDWLYIAIIPNAVKDEIEQYIPDDLMQKVIYINNDCKDIWEWSEKVYSAVEKHNI